MAKPKILTGLDIGTHSIKIVVAQKEKKEKTPEIIKCEEFYSFGLRKGAVVNVMEVAKNTRNALFNIEKEIDQKIDSVFVNIGSSYLKFIPSHGLVSVSRADQKISPEDIERVIKASQTVNLPSNYEILDIFPQGFIIDNQPIVKNPKGLTGIRLEARVSLFCVFATDKQNLTQAVLETGRRIENITASPLAASRAVLTPKEKELGVAVVNIGAATTGLAVFEEGELIHLAVLPMGSANITNDIAIGLRTKIDTAEKIKKEFGSCSIKKSGSSRGKEKINVSPNEKVYFPHSFLTKIVRTRVSEIFEFINKELKKISRSQLLPAGIILTGGGAKLKNIEDTAKEELKLPVRIGAPKDFIGIKPDVVFSTAVGLILDDDAEENDEDEVLEGAFSKIKKFFRIFTP